MKFIIFNGPVGAGKTKASRIMSSYLSERLGQGSVITDSFAAPMKHFLAVGLGVKYHDLNRDSPMAVLSGYTAREFLIDLSENYMKPRYGRDVFGRLLYNRAMRMTPPPQVVICDDSGFIEEAESIPEQDRIIIRIIRPGATYENDSRSFLEKFDYWLENTSGIDGLEERTMYIARHILANRM